MAATSIDQTAVIATLNQILESELAGVVRYTHYSFMICGYGRIPIVGWLRSQANESLLHAQEAGELITALGGHPSLAIGELLETHRHQIGDILQESLSHERAAIGLYEELLERVQGRNVMVEEFARQKLAAEYGHLSEVDKMLRQPGSLATSPE